VQLDHGPPVTTLFTGVAADTESTFVEPYE
jgi:hypothetical protein